MVNEDTTPTKHELIVVQKQTTDQARAGLSAPVDCGTWDAEAMANGLRPSPAKGCEKFARCQPDFLYVASVMVLVRRIARAS
jgi:hypothetical protein